MGLEDEKTEVEQLKERLRMAEEAYKEKYVECEMLENQLIKQQRRIGVYWSCFFISYLSCIL